MNILINNYDSIETIIFNENLKIISLEFNISLDKMYVHLNNANSFVVPTKRYERLTGITLKALKNYKIIAGGTGIHWPDLDEDLSLKGFLKDFLIQKIQTENQLVLREY